MIILRYHEIFFRLTAPRCPSMATGAVSLRKSHDIRILSFCNIVKGQAKYEKTLVNITCISMISAQSEEIAHCEIFLRIYKPRTK